MKRIITYKNFIIESGVTFTQFLKVIESLKKMCDEFVDAGCLVKILPEGQWQDEIKMNILSLQSRNILGRIKIPFYIEISNVHKIIEYNYLPDWFVDNCRTIESLMKSANFKTLPSIERLSREKENLETINDLEDISGIYKSIKLEFIPDILDSQND